MERRRPGRPQYGALHKAVRKEYLARYKPGQKCVRCGHPTFYPQDRLDLDHRDDGRGYLGLSHSSPCRTCGERCNQAAGGEKAQRNWQARNQPQEKSKGRKW